MCKIHFLFLIWETSSKAPFRTYCQYSYFLHLFFSLLCGRRAQRRPFGLIASTLMFSIFSFSFSFSLFFFYFAHIVVFGIPFYSIWKAQFSIKTIFLVQFKFSFLQLLKHSFSSICWSNMRLVPITQGYPKHHQKFSNRSLIWTIAQIFHLQMQETSKHDLNADTVFFYSPPQAWMKHCPQCLNSHKKR